MKKTVNIDEFIDTFKAVRPDNFSFLGLRKLFEYIEEYEDDIGEEIEFDPIALCCEFSEMTLDEVRDYYEVKEMNDEDLLEWLRDNTTVIEFDDRCIIQDF